MNTPSAAARTLLAASLMALAAGCASSPADTSPGAPGAPEIPAISLWPGMKTIDAHPVFPQSLSTTKPIHAVLDVESLSNRAITIQYRIQWLNAQGKTLNPDGPFKIMNMAPRTKSRLDITDPNASAASWRAEFRPAM